MHSNKLSPLALLSLSIVAAVSAVVPVSGQSQNQYDKGTPPQHAVGVSPLGSYISTELGTINLSNGSLNFRIPLATVGGRGDVSFPITLNYSSKLWSASIDTDYERTYMTQVPVAYADYDAGLGQAGALQTMIGAGWSIGRGPTLQAKRILIGKITSGPNAGCYSYTLTKLTLYLPDRGEVEFRDDATNGAPLSSVCTAPASRGTRWHATDGSGAIFINDVDNGVAQWPVPNLSGVVITADGTRLGFGANGIITDRNGNKITGADQLGRTITIQQNVPDPHNGAITLPWLITVPGYQGQSRYYKIKTGIMNQNYRAGISPALPVITGDWDPEGWGYNWWGNPTRLFQKSYGLYAQRIDDIDVLTELVLPDGRSLKFRYNEYGEVAEVELPTGGKIQYDYNHASGFPTGNSPLWETGTGGSGSGITTDVKQVDRGIKEKRTYPDGVTLEGRWNYGYAGTNSWMTVKSSSDVLLSHEIHYFLTGSRYTEYPYSPGNHDGTHYNLWSTGVEWRTEVLNAAGAVIAASENDWTQRTPVSWVGYPTEQPAQDNRINQTRKYLDNGVMAKVETIYDQYNNPTEVKEYDFDQSLKRRTTTSYVTNLNGYNYATNDNIHLLRLPSQQSLFDAGGTEKARTTYEYDNYINDGLHAPLVDYGTVTQHDSAYNASKITRGNVTAIGRWLNTTNTTIWTYNRYDKLGNVISTRDARGNVTSISFTDDFGVGTNPGSGSQGTYGATYALPTLVTSPPPQAGAPAHTARTQYDFSTGLPTGQKDPNNVISQIIYNDPFNRPTLKKAALGVSGVESHTANYYAPMTIYGVTLARNDVLTASDKDALDDGILRSWTVTDGFGRTKETWVRAPEDTKTVTNYDALGRAVQTSNPFRPSLSEVAIYTTIAFDLAGRVISVTTPDSAVVSTSYSGNTVTVTDQAGKKRKSVTDALGRLKEVYEDPTAVNYLTTYEYDVLNNLVKVIQDNNPQTPAQPPRAFVYDSLSRLKSATNPESGNITYDYDANGNLTEKIDARGSAFKITYAYDALNRNTQVNYTDSTPDILRQYDLAINGKGRLNQAWQTGTTTSATYIDSYDALGRPLVQRQRYETSGVWSSSYQVSRAYNLAGAVTSQTYPSGRTVNYSYDVAGRATTFTGNLGDGTQRTYTSQISYWPVGGMQKEQFGTDTPLYNKHWYNSRGQLAEIRVSTTYTGAMDTSWNRGAIINHYSLQCWGMCYGQNSTQPMTDNNGNVYKQEHQIPGDEQISTHAVYTTWHNYDALNRLSSVNGDRYNSVTSQFTNPWKQTFIYDRYGNRRIDPNPANTYGGVNNKDFTVNTANNRLGVPGGQSGVMSYDPAGNLTTDTYTGAGSRTYDAENRMTQAVGGSQGATQYYTYNADGQRTRRKIDGSETWQIYGFEGELLAEYAQNGAAASPQKEYGYRNGQLLVTAEPASLPMIPNAGFELPVVGSGSFQYSPSGGSWIFAGGTGVSGNSSAFTSGNPSAPQGVQVAFIQGGNTSLISQSVSGWQSGINYSVSFQAAQRGNCCGAGGQDFDVYLDTTLLGTFKPTGTAYLLLATPTFTTTAGTHTLKFVGRNSLGGDNTAFIDDLRITTAQNVSWTSVAPTIQVTGNSLQKVSGTSSWYDAGAVSSQTIQSGDGYVEFTPGNTATWRMIGLGNGNSSDHYADIEFAFHVAGGGGGLHIYEAGVYRGQFGTYTSNDRLRVAVESGVVKYRKNGALVYTSTVTPTYPLLVDTSLNTVNSQLLNVVISAGGGSGSDHIKWLVADHLGTPRMVFDKTGSLANTRRHDYLAFGEEWFAGMGGRTTGEGYVADGVRQKFTLKERDVETGLDYFLARYYSSTQGRFASPDEFKGGPRELWVLGSGHPEKQALVYAEVTNPQSLNKYQYCFNNPLRYIDPDGQSPQDGYDIQFQKTIKDFNEGRIDEKEYWARMRGGAVGVAGGFAIIVAARGGAAGLTALATWATRNPDKVQQIAQGLQEAAGGPPGLTLGPSSRLTAAEISTGGRLAKQLGVSLTESAHRGEEFVVTGTKTTIDAMGGAQAYQHFGNGSKFFESIVHHVNKSADYTAIDLQGASKSQVKAVQKFVSGLSEEQRRKIIYVQ